MTENSYGLIGKSRISGFYTVAGAIDPVHEKIIERQITEQMGKEIEKKVGITKRRMPDDEQMMFGSSGVMHMEEAYVFTRAELEELMQKVREEAEIVRNIENMILNGNGADTPVGFVKSQHTETE